MKGRHALWAVVMLVSVVASGCVTRTPKYQANLVVKSITQEDAYWGWKHWHIVVANDGNSWAKVGLVSITAYNALGEEIEHVYDPGLDGKPLDGLVTLCDEAGDCDYELYEGRMAYANVFRGVDGIAKMKIALYWNDLANPDIWTSKTVTLSVPYNAE